MGLLARELADVGVNPQPASQLIEHPRSTQIAAIHRFLMQRRRVRVTRHRGVQMRLAQALQVFKPGLFCPVEIRRSRRLVTRG